MLGPGAKFAYAPNRSYTPPDAPKEQLVALHKHLRILASGARAGKLPRHRHTRGPPERRAVLYRIPDPLELKTTSAAEGVAVDAQGNVYGGEVGPQQLVKHTKIP